MFMEAVVAERAGNLSEVLTCQRVDRADTLAPGEVEVRMLASTVNPSDAVAVSGAYRSRTKFPFVPGFEGVGVVERAGQGVPASAVGQRVLPIGSAGNWQQYKKTQYSWCIPIPDYIPNAVACFAYINPLTALLMMQRFCSTAMRNVAITAATSTISGHLAELLTAQGVRPIGLIQGTSGHTVRTPGLWRSVIATSEPGWTHRLTAAAGTAGLDLVFDSVGGTQGATLMGMLRNGGVLAHYGLLSGDPLPPECFTGSHGKSIEFFRLRDTIHARPHYDFSRLFVPVFEHLRDGRLHTQVSERIPLAKLPQRLKRTAGWPGKTLIAYDPCGHE